MNGNPEIQMWKETPNYRLERVNDLFIRCHIVGIAYQVLQDNEPNRVRFNLSTEHLSVDTLKRRLEHDAEVSELDVWADKRQGWEGTVHADFFVEVRA